jgi:hypothetical protein
MNSIIYTFRTFPYKAEVGANFVFGNLKRDFDDFKVLLDTEPENIVGVALTNGKSKIETRGVNRFGKTKTIVKDGVGEFSLHIPELKLFPVSGAYTTSFCNWTMYRISEFIFAKKLKTKLTFVHINKSDIPQLKDLIKNLK